MPENNFGKWQGCNNKKCIFNKWKNRDQKRVITKFQFDNSFVFVPREHGTFGHLLLITREHFNDLTTSIPAEVAKEIIEKINYVCMQMKQHLQYRGKKVSRVYLASLNETGGENSHMHFHLIPRYEDEKTGFEFLYSLELEEAKLKLNGEDREYTPDERLRSMQGKIEGELSLLHNNKWRRFRSSK